MEEFVAYSSRLRTACLLLGALAFVALGLWMVGVFGSAPTSSRYPALLFPVAGWVSILFFGLAAAMWSRRLFDRKPQLSIGAAGIRSTPWSDQTIPWSEITEITTWEFNGQQTIILHLRDRTRFPGRRLAAMLADANRGLTGGDVSISLTGTDRTVDAALSSIERFHSAGN